MIVSKYNTFHNIVYASLAKGATLLCLAVSTSVVARNLLPSDYGLVGFATIVIGFLSHFNDLGISNAVIRHPSLDQRGLQTAFSLKILLSSGTFCAAIFIAPSACHLFQHPETGNVIRVLALNFLLSTIGFLPLVTLTREINYRALIIPGVVSSIVRCALTVTLILEGCKYWAVIFADIGATVASGIFMQIIKRVPVGLSFERAEAREYLRVGLPLLGTGVVVFLIFNLDNFLIGSSMGSTQLGYYALAFTWGSFICGLLSETVNNVLVPTFSAIQGNLVAMRRWYLKTIDLVGFIAVVANGALLANAHFFLVAFLGQGTDKWLPAALPFKILCVYGIVRATTEPVGNCFMARGRTKALWHANLLGGVVEVLLLLIALRNGRIDMVAAAVLAAYACTAAAVLHLLRREFSIGIGDIIAQVWPVAPALVVGCLVTSLVPSSFGSTMATLVARVLITAATVAITHGFCTRFRCIQEASGLISQNFAGIRA